MIPGFWPVNDKLYTPVTMKFMSNHDPCAVKWHAPNKAPPWHSKSSGSCLQGGWYSRSSGRMCWWIQSNLRHHGMKIEEWKRYRNPIVKSNVQKIRCSTSFPTRILTTSWMTITLNWIDVWLPLKFSPFQWHLAVKMSGYFFLKLLGSGKETLGRPRPLNISMLLFDQFHPSIFSSCLLFETTSWGW